jgi:hypothetical protein
MAISFPRRIRARALLQKSRPRKKAEGAKRRKARTIGAALARRGARLAIGALASRRSRGTSNPFSVTETMQ